LKLVVPRGQKLAMPAPLYLPRHTAAEQTGNVEGAHASLGELPIQHYDGFRRLWLIEDQIVGPVIPMHDGSGHVPHELGEAITLPIQPVTDRNLLRHEAVVHVMAESRPHFRELVLQIQILQRHPRESFERGVLPPLRMKGRDGAERRERVLPGETSDLIARP